MLHDDLKKKYESLQKNHKKVGQAFQNQELTALLEESAEEIASLVQSKDEVIKNLEAPQNAKKVIAEL